jgi:outer membrane protein
LAQLRILLLSAFCSSLSLSGCAVDQAKEVATYRAVLDRNMPEVVAPAIDEDWTLQKALLVANKSNEQLGVQGEDYLQALIDKSRAVAAFLPTLSVSPSESFAHTRGVSTDNATTVTAHAGMNIFNGFRDWYALKRAAVTIEQQRALLLDLQESLLLNVAQSYYAILKSEESARVLENSLSLRHEQVRDMSARQEQGLARALDVAQAQADESATRVLLLQAQSDARTGRATLAFLVGVPAINGPLADDITAPGAVPTVEEFEQAAMQYRQDLVAAERAVEAARFAVNEAVGEYYPSVSLSFSYLLYTSPLAALLWSGAISGDIPIFTGGTIHADVRSAWSRFRQAGLSLAMLQRQIHEQAAIDAENLSISAEKIKELQVSVDASQRAFDLADQSYKLGSASNLDRLTAQNTLLAAQLSLNSERYSEKVFYLDALRVSGQLVDRIARQLPSPEPQEPVR